MSLSEFFSCLKSQSPDFQYKNSNSVSGYLRTVVHNVHVKFHGNEGVKGVGKILSIHATTARTKTQTSGHGEALGFRFRKINNFETIYRIDRVGVVLSM